MPTNIEWCDESWNPIRTTDGGYHCTKVSPGCLHCYAERFNNRFGNKKPFDASPTKFTINETILARPGKFKKPRRIFVESMGDLFHDDIDPEDIYTVFDVIVKYGDHVFCLLTKRPARMRQFIAIYTAEIGIIPNLWLGVTAENKAMADERIPILLETPAAKRFASIEPMLGPINLRHSLDWIICGGETGQAARPLHPDWARVLRDQCQGAGVPFFFKHWGGCREVFRFKSQTHWINKASTHVAKGDIYLDMDGKVCRRGADFATARYPVAVMRPTLRKRVTGRELDGREWNEVPE